MKAEDFVRAQIEVYMVAERHKLLNEEGRWAGEGGRREYRCGWCMEKLYAEPSVGIHIENSLKDHWKEKSLEALEDNGYSVRGEMR